MGGVSQKMTIADEGGRGVSQKMTIADKGGKVQINVKLIELGVPNMWEEKTI